MSEDTPLFRAGNKYPPTSSDDHEIYELYYEGNIVEQQDGYIAKNSMDVDSDSRNLEIKDDILIKGEELFRKLSLHTLGQIMKDIGTLHILPSDCYFEDNFQSSLLYKIYVIDISYLTADGMPSPVKTENLENHGLTFHGDVIYEWANKYPYIMAFITYISLDSWSNTWTAREHKNAIIRSLEENEQFVFLGETAETINFAGNYDQVYGYYICNILGYDSNTKNLGENIKDFMSLFSSAQAEVINGFRDRASVEYLVQEFEFPEEVKTACKQYLIYFTEFLQDVGVNATSSIEEENGNTRFLVEPQSKDEALEGIAELLRIYLRLPSSPVANSYPDPLQFNPAAQRLAAQVQHFNGQLMMANSALQALNSALQLKDVTIQKQKDEILKLRQFTAMVLIEAMKLDESNEELILGGLVKFKEYELFGIAKLNFPEVVRRLKDRFGQN